MDYHSKGKVWENTSISNLWISEEAEVHTIAKNMGKVNLHSTGKVWENTEISHSVRYLADLELMRTHSIPNVWECTNSHKMEIFCGKPYHSQAVGF